MAVRPSRATRTTTMVLVGLVTAFGCGSGSSLTAPTPSATPSPTATPSPSLTPSAGPSPSASPSTSPTAVPPPPTKPRALREGASGPAVLALQQELTELGYWLGTPDGEYGDLTEQAVLAVQKAAGLARDGRVGPRTVAALEAGVRPVPQSTA